MRTFHDKDTIRELLKEMSDQASEHPKDEPFTLTFMLGEHVLVLEVRLVSVSGPNHENTH